MNAPAFLHTGQPRYSQGNGVTCSATMVEVLQTPLHITKNAVGVAGAATITTICATVHMMVAPIATLTA